jgi:hypothetical protein
MPRQLLCRRLRFSFNSKGDISLIKRFIKINTSAKFASINNNLNVIVTNSVITVANEMRTLLTKDVRTST